MKTTSQIIKTLLGAVLSLLVTIALTQNAAAQTRIAFSAAVTDQKTHGTYSQIFWMNTDGTGVRQLTKASAHSVYPYWSPGQQYILFNRGGIMYVMEASGKTNPRTFAVGPGYGAGADWSPDSSKICFLGPGAVATNGLYIVDVNPATGQVGTPTLVREGNWLYAPSWSPDGTRIAFSSGTGTSVVTVLDLATRTEFSFGGPQGYGIDPCWSPDASHIAFSGISPVTITTGNITTTYNYLEIFIAKADGSEITKVTSLNNFTTDMATWAPDGTALVFRSKVNGTVSNNSIYKTVLSTGAVTWLYSGGVTPDWAP